MAVSDALKLSKEERICSRRLLDELFSGTGSHSLVAFPLRAVFMETEEAGAQMLISVPKRHFKRAVKRNRVKRQVREAYRKHKHILAERLAAKTAQPSCQAVDASTTEKKGVAIAFIWLDPHLCPSVKVDSKVENLLLRISERL